MRESFKYNLNSAMHSRDISLFAEMVDLFLPRQENDDSGSLLVYLNTTNTKKCCALLDMKLLSSW